MACSTLHSYRRTHILKGTVGDSPRRVSYSHPPQLNVQPSRRCALGSKVRTYLPPPLNNAASTRHSAKDADQGIGAGKDH